MPKSRNTSAANAQSAQNADDQTTAASRGELSQFDLIMLMVMLSQNERSGLLEIHETPHSLECWLHKGRVVHLQSTELMGVPALTLILSQLMSQPQGYFFFKENKSCYRPSMDSSVDGALYHALAHLPEKELPCEGPARFSDPKRIASMEWNEGEQKVLMRVKQGEPLLDITSDARARNQLARLARLGLLKKRSVRTARLILTLTHDVMGVVVVDQKLLRRWQDDLGRRVNDVVLRTDDNELFSFLVKQSPDLGTDLLVPPDIFMRHHLYGGEAVMVRPI